jgi:hypothetical protein
MEHSRSEVRSHCGGNTSRRIESGAAAASAPIPGAIVPAHDNLPIGLLMNFNVALLRNGLQRITPVGPREARLK